MFVPAFRKRAVYLKNRLLVDNPETLEDIGSKFAISRERVRQIEKKGL